MTVEQMMHSLRKEKINTWFDLGLFIDKFKENINIPSINYRSYNDFKRSLSKGGIAIITFIYSIDGVTMESEKYAGVFRKLFNEIKIHYIAGQFHEKAELYLLPDTERFQLDELNSFNDWELYKDFFYEKLKRGSKTYNKLILKFRDEVLVITEKLGNYIEENDIKLLYLINTNSNPGNISLALALVLISEMLGLPVICNNHDFYWESGHSEIDIQMNAAKPGPRDHFFKNYHLGEVFSILETIYPWESRSWISVNINDQQSDKLINMLGHNPASVAEIGTAIFTEKFHIIKDDKRKKEIYKQIAAIFRNYKSHSIVLSASAYSKRQFNCINDIAPVLLGSRDQKEIDFVNNNLIMLQPTRIIHRKKIEVDYILIKQLFDDEEFVEYFEKNSDLKLTLLVTGPIASGHLNYFLKLINEFNVFISSVNKKYQDRIFLGFLFSEFDKPSFRKKYNNPISFTDVFNVSSIVLLPSETEGRGLPIIEASACGIPVFCRRYYPEEVYKKVIGEHLPKQDRLRVIEFTDPQLNHDIIEDVKQQFFSSKSYEKNILHNQEIVEKRYSITSLTQEFEAVLYKLYLQITSTSSSAELAVWALDKYKTHIRNNKEYVKNILNTKNRQYLAGYGQMSLMIFLKSLIDPSYFRVEEQRFRGMAMKFAKELVDNNPDPTPLAKTAVHEFYNSVDSIFSYHNGEINIQLDHSFAYRHRNKNYYSYRDLTFQELTGVINLLFKRIAAPPPGIKIGKDEHLSKDWAHNITTIFNNKKPAINHLEELEQKLNLNIPIALFPGKNIELELELFVLHPLRKRLKLKDGEKIFSRHLQRKKLAPVFIIQHEQPLGKSITADVLRSYIYYSENSELKLLFNHGICKIISSKQHSVGIHFYEVGEQAARILHYVKKHNGIIIAFGDHAAMMTDIVDIDRFHIGEVSNILAARILGIPNNSAYIQWIPAGLRFNLAFPTPNQDGLKFSKVLKSFRYKKLCDLLGKEKVLQILKEDAEEKSTPIKTVLTNLDTSASDKTDVTYSSISGIYTDSLPWAGVLANINIKKYSKKWEFSVVTAKDKPKTVLSFVEEFNISSKRKARVAWNGGYILNPELVGKLGLPELFIGSPLGLIISKSKVLSLPLFNKPAFIVLSDGSLEIKRVNCSQGITVSDSINSVTFGPEVYNPHAPAKAPCFYDLLYPDDYIEAKGRIIVRLAGVVIKDIIYNKNKVPVMPVGITLSFPKDQFPSSFEVGRELTVTMNGWDDIKAAVEAGPQLLKDGEICIDMKDEGWKTKNSIITQAARLDYLDMRGPKIAIGIDISGNLSVLTVNGRIRESVGATHVDMAEILKSRGMIYAMGFDPGGSSTLVVDDKILNISPYNPEYEKNVYSLPPEPRAVSNSLIISEPIS